LDQLKLSQDRSSQVVTGQGQVKSEIFLDPKYFWTQIVFFVKLHSNLQTQLNFSWLEKELTLFSHGRRKEEEGITLT